MLPRNTFRLAFLTLSVSGSYAKDKPAAHGPPPDADPLTYGWYATPEIPDPVPLQVVGKFPSWVSGSLYRGAAATWDAGNWTAEHWFDGFSRNHRFEIREGEVTYRSRNASDEVMDFVEEHGRYPDGSFAGDPCKIIFGALETHFRDGVEPRGSVSKASIPVAFAPNYPGLDRNTSSNPEDAPFSTLVITTDDNSLQQIDPVTLEPIELFTYQAQNPLLVNDGRSAAHPAHFDDGSLYNYVLDMSTDPPEYHVFGVDPSNGRGRVLATITDAPPAYLHSIFNTENHIILVVWQADYVRSSPTLLGAIGPWDPKRKTLFYVVDRENGGVRAKYVADDVFFAFHQVNSFENAHGDIIIDLPTMKDTSFIHSATIPYLRANVGQRVEGRAKADIPGTFTRYRLPAPGCSNPDGYGKDTKGKMKMMKAEKVFQLPYSAANIELPRINPDYDRKAYRYAYGIHVDKPGFFADSIVKLDLEKQKPKIWTPEHNGLPSEPVFIAAPDAENEDDGILLSVVMDSHREKSSLVAINATTMEEVAQAQMPIVMGYGFHGVWGSDM